MMAQFGTIATTPGWGHILPQRGRDQKMHAQSWRETEDGSTYKYRTIQPNRTKMASFAVDHAPHSGHERPKPGRWAHDM